MSWIRVSPGVYRNTTTGQIRISAVSPDSTQDSEEPGARGNSTGTGGSRIGTGTPGAGGEKPSTGGPGGVRQPAAPPSHTVVTTPTRTPPAATPPAAKPPVDDNPMWARDWKGRNELTFSNQLHDWNKLSREQQQGFVDEAEKAGVTNGLGIGVGFLNPDSHNEWLNDNEYRKFWDNPAANDPWATHPQKDDEVLANLSLLDSYDKRVKEALANIAMDKLSKP